MRELFKKYQKEISAAGIFFVLLLILSFFVGGFSPSSVRVLDARISFQFTAYQDKEEHFVAYSLENTKKNKVKTAVRVQLGTTGLGFKKLMELRDTAVLEPLETRSFVTKFEIPKAKVPKNKTLGAKVKVKRVSRV